jgi:hypothetical protein
MSTTVGRVGSQIHFTLTLGDPTNPVPISNLFANLVSSNTSIASIVKKELDTNNTIRWTVHLAAKGTARLVPSLQPNAPVPAPEPITVVVVNSTATPTQCNFVVA